MNPPRPRRLMPGITTSAAAPAPLLPPAPLVVVQREWDGWRRATVRLSDLEGVHWRQPPGAHRPLIHAYVSCDRLLPGTALHGCDADTAPHRLRVCVLKAHALIGTFAELSRRADEAADH
jgi:hypothetical protein